MPGVKLNDLAGAAQSLLDLFVAKLRTTGISFPIDEDGNEYPIYISPGPEAGGAWDHPGIQCFLNDLHQGVPGRPDTSQSGAYLTLWTATFAIVILRSVVGLTDNGLPDYTSIQADAVATMDDAAAMAIAASLVRADGSWVMTGEPAVIGSVTPLAPAGYIGGNMITFEAVAD